MIISEMFATVQGEGSLAGVPSLFIRVSGCNLRCVWCDTPYTSWNPAGTESSLDEILAWVDRHPSYRHVVLTGGEPMLYPAIVPLTEQLRARRLHITIETAGTVDQPVVCDLMSISPKLANSTPWQRDPAWAERHERLRMQMPVLLRLTGAYDYQLKFVVASPGDLREVEQLAQSLGAPSHRVLLMPEGIDAVSLQERSLWLVELCKERGYRFCPRLHVLIWGNRRGV